MNRPREKTAKPTAPSPARRGIALCGTLLFAVGSLLPVFVPGAAASGSFVGVLRWAGLLLLAAYGIRRKSLTYWIFWSMLAGATFGVAYPRAAENLRVFSDIFLRLIKVIVAPLILSTLITGIAAHGDLGSIKRIGIKSIVYFELVTTIALFIGLAAINISRAGVGVAVASPNASAPVAAATQFHWSDFLLHIFPENLPKSIVEDQILQVAVFAIIFGIALALVPEPKRRPMLNLFDSLAQVMFRFTNIVMYFAPLGVGAAMAYTVGQLGTGVLLPLAKLLATAYAAFILFILLVLLPIAFWIRLPIRKFVEAIVEPATIAFATSTSEAALPRAMECMEKFGVPREIVAFVIPAGYSFNMDGSTIYLSLASVFAAQMAGIHLSWPAQFAMSITLMLTSKGMAGVPRAVLVILLATASTFHLPTEPIFVILGIDALIDMGRTALNVIGNCLACAVVARWEGELAPKAAKLEAVS